MTDAPDLARYRRPLVFGGTFDPPHLAHVEQPRRVARSLGADVVLYIPAAQSPHKVGQPPTPSHHRLAMLILALQHQPWALVLTDELDRSPGSQPSYTVDTLEALRPRLHPGAEMRLLIGTDQALAFERWKDWRRVEALAEPVVMVRPPESTQALSPQWQRRVVTLPPLDISSTLLRARLREGRLTAGLLDPAVAAYIAEHGLYRVPPIERADFESDARPNNPSL